MLSDLPGELFAGLDRFPSGNGTVQADIVYSKSIVEQISQLCIDAFADFCAVYLRSVGQLPAGFAARDEALTAALGGEPFDDVYEQRAIDAGIETIGFTAQPPVRRRRGWPSA